MTKSKVALPDPSQTLPLRLLRWTVPVAILIVFLFGIAGAVRLGLSLGQPFSGVVLSWRKDWKLYAVSTSTPAYWPGLTAGLEINDRLLCLDDYMPNPNSLVYGLEARDAVIDCPNGAKNHAVVFRELFHNPDSTVSYLIDREGDILTLSSMPITKFTLWMLLELYLPQFALAMGMLIIGAITYRANPGVELNLVFALLAAIIAAYTIDRGFGLIITDRFEDARVISILLAVPWIALIGAVYLHVVSLFTVDGSLRKVTIWLRRPYYVVSILFALLGLLVYILHDQPISFVLTPHYFYFVGGSCVFAAGMGTACLIWTWYKAPAPRVRHQAKLMLLGLIGLLIFFVPIMISGFSDIPLPRTAYIAPYLGLAAIAIFAYAILRYQLFASRAGILTALLVVIWCVLVSIVTAIAANQLVGFLPILVATLVASLGLLARWGPTTIFTRLLRRETLDYRTVVHFSQRVGGLQQTESLLQAANTVLCEDLDVEHMDVWLLGPQHRILERYSDGQVQGTVSIPSGFVDQLLAHPEPVHATEPAGYRVQPDDPESDSVAVWAPLVDRGQAVGLLGLGARWTGDVYDDLDLQLTGILARQLALSILTTRQYESLQATADLIQQAQEHERLRIARELHDTILQFLLVLTYGLDGLKEQATEAATEIERWQDRISLESGRLRGMLSYLRAPEVLVQHGLVPAIELWIGQVSEGTTVSIQAKLVPEAAAALPEEAQVAIYRVFREAIYNALKHAESTGISVRLDTNRDQVCFAIEDDGQGFDVRQAMGGKGKGYSSLRDMQTYIKNVGGSLTIDSAPGQGTVVSGTVPVTGA